MGHQLTGAAGVTNPGVLDNPKCVPHREHQHLLGILELFPLKSVFSPRQTVLLHSSTLTATGCAWWEGETAPPRDPLQQRGLCPVPAPWALLGSPRKKLSLGISRGNPPKRGCLLRGEHPASAQRVFFLSAATKPTAVVLLP